jgi:hypothetical protein
MNNFLPASRRFAKGDEFHSNETLGNNNNKSKRISELESEDNKVFKFAVRSDLLLDLNAL